MYENNYPNSYNNTSTEHNTVNNTNYGQGGSNTYHYGSSGSFSGAGGNFQGADAYQQSRNTGKPGKNHKNSTGFGKKIAIGICCGLCFGIFAGLGFQAVDTATDFLKDKAGFGQSQEASAAIEQNTGEGEGSGSNLEDVAQNTESNTQVAGTQVIQTTVTDVSEVAKAVMPAVVSVNNKYVEKLSFFGQEYSQEATGSGSGIIVGQNDTELLVVTNYHVIESAEELTVQFVDGTLSQAQVKGSNSSKDLAVIAVQLSDIENDTMSQIAIAEIGSSNDLTVGEPVIAIGNALGYGQSVTTGVVSALNRPIAASTATTEASYYGDEEISTFIQTDAAINPGNSGGPLLNIKGQVIGINSNKIGGSAVEGMGYAIPISDVQDIIEDLMSKETRLKVDEDKKGYIGITGVDVVEEYSQLYGAPQGIYVSKVMEGSGAYEAGLVRGDIITGINGETVTSMAQLQEELSYYEAGTTVELTIMQGSPTGYQEKVVEVTLGQQSSVR